MVEQAAIDPQKVGVPSKILTVILVVAGAFVLYVGLAIVASLVVTTVGAFRAVPAAYLVAAIGVPILVTVRSIRSSKEPWRATRHAAIASLTMNLVLVPVVLGPALVM